MREAKGLAKKGNNRVARKAGKVTGEDDVKVPADLTSALKGQPAELIMEWDLEALHVLWQGVRNTLHWWMGDPSEKRLRDFERTVPGLSKLVDFDVLVTRLGRLGEFGSGHFGLHISDFAPEFTDVHRAAGEAIDAFKADPIRKAEAWLRPIAAEAGADADLEAAVYFASRGQSSLVDVDRIRQSWHRSICSDIQMGKPVGNVPDDLVERAKRGSISLAEAAEVLTFNDTTFRFFSFREEEEDFIDATMYRGVEWFDIRGFEPWLRSMVADMSTGPQYGIDHNAAAWWLFYMCRSDLVLSMADRRGADAWLWALMNGPHDREKPWMFFYPDRENPGPRAYVPTAGLLGFIWSRLRPKQIDRTVVDSAMELVIQSQMACGGWPTMIGESEPSILSTMASIHGLATVRPQGWKAAAQRGAEWLLAQQEPVGCWHVGGGPTVMLTVLALDSIELSRGGSTVTYRVTSGVGERREELGGGQVTTASAQVAPHPLPRMTSQRLDDVRKTFAPEVLLLVATETELKHVLGLLQPPDDQQQVFRISYDQNTFYAGRFGACKAVVAMCQMGSGGPGGATLVADSGIQVWHPRAVLMVGIAFGARPEKHREGDVLVAESIRPYELQRVGADPVLRSPVPPTSTVLINRFRNAIDWEYKRPDGSTCAKHFGLVLSGEKLVDDAEFKAKLIEQHPTAVGGEMEGAGLWAACANARVEWVLVKGVCDWADGEKHDGYQDLAAASAASLALHVLSDPNVFDGVPHVSREAP